MATAETNQKQKPSWVVSHWKVLAIHIVVVLVVISLALFIPVRITIDLTYTGNYSYSVQICIDDREPFNLTLSAYTSRLTSLSFSVGVGPHTVVIRSGQTGWELFRETTIAWPFIGNSVSFTIPWG